MRIPSPAMFYNDASFVGSNDVQNCGLGATTRYGNSALQCFNQSAVICGLEYVKVHEVIHGVLREQDAYDEIFINMR